jgi:RimJ/RimL family protein N-acetyltransferase
MAHNRPGILETERLILRPLAADDFEAVHSWAGNPANTRYMSWGPNSEDQTREFLAATRPGRDFAVVLRESGAVVGSCGIYPDDTNDTGELGWILHQGSWGRGLGTELGGELIRHGFEDLGLRRIQALCAAVNHGSYRVMEHNGMRREALHRKALWARVDKEWIDLAVYAILADEYHGRPARAPGPTKAELQEAHRALSSTLHKCEKMDRARLGKSQRTLLERRIAALGSALWLIERECGTP